MKATNHAATKDFKDLTPDEIAEQNLFDLREMMYYYGGWDELRKVIDSLEDSDNERAFDNWMESRYSIDGIAEHNARNEPRTKDSYIDGER